MQVNCFKIDLRHFSSHLLNCSLFFIDNQSHFFIWKHIGSVDKDKGLVIKGTVKILKFGTPQTIAIIVLKIEKFDVTLHYCIQKMLMEWQTV